MEGLAKIRYEIGWTFGFWNVWFLLHTFYSCNLARPEAVGREFGLNMITIIPNSSLSLLKKVFMQNSSLTFVILLDMISNTVGISTHYWSVTTL